MLHFYTPAMPTARQKKRRRKWLLIIMVTAGMALSGIMTLQWLTYRRARFVRYPEFGIAIPESYSIHGIDVSKYQSTIAWEEVKAMQVRKVKLGFAFIKATQGEKNEDPQFARNWKKAREAGMLRGAYHFFIPSGDGTTQARNFIQHVTLEEGDLPPVLDIEQLNGISVTQLKREVKEWLAVAEEHYGVKPLIYTNVDFYNRFLGDDFDAYPLWIAHYYQQQQPRIQRGWLFWQHSDQGQVNGIAAHVDFNVFNGDSAEFRNMLMR